MTAPNRATLWGRVIVDELAASGVTDVCLAPGSRCTPLTVAAAEHDEVETFSHLDERSAAFFALGRARRSNGPVALVCTSGTAAANFHPAVIEAHQSRVPLVVLTADRPAELQDSGANQTIDQSTLYGNAVRNSRTLPEPAPEPRRLRSLRTAVSRAAATSTCVYPGPVHLNVPFAKPLEPTPVDGDVPEDLAERASEAVVGRDGPYVRTNAGRPMLDEGSLDTVASAIRDADHGLIVSGPANEPEPSRDALTALADATGFPVLADPLSGHRFGEHVEEVPICGGYDAYLDEDVPTEDGWPKPDVVVRFGASPTSKPLRHYLRERAHRTFLVDPAGQWREAEFTATDHLLADETALARALSARIDRSANELTERFLAAEASHWDRVDDGRSSATFEGTIAATVVDALPDPATLYVSNSMPVRDVDRFAKPSPADVSVLGNRGASGIDGVTSSALGAASATADPLVCLIGDLAFYHDMNGLLAIARLGIDATIVLVNNDGGGIFHKLPIEGFEPPFTDLFKTPHGLDFSPTEDLYTLDYERVETTAALASAVERSTTTDGTQVVEIQVDAAESHRRRDALE